MNDYPESVVRTRRRAVGLALRSTAETVHSLAESDLGARLENDMQFIEPKEQAALEKLQKALAPVEKNLRALAKRLGVE